TGGCAGAPGLPGRLAAGDGGAERADVRDHGRRASRVQDPVLRLPRRPGRDRRPPRRRDGDPAGRRRGPRREEWRPDRRGDPQGAARVLRGRGGCARRTGGVTFAVLGRDERTGQIGGALATASIDAGRVSPWTRGLVPTYTETGAM